jgi:hypothetical protein
MKEIEKRKNIGDRQTGRNTQRERERTKEPKKERERERKKESKRKRERKKEGTKERVKEQENEKSEGNPANRPLFRSNLVGLTSGDPACCWLQPSASGSRPLSSFLRRKTSRTFRRTST